MPGIAKRPLEDEAVKEEEARGEEKQVKRGRPITQLPDKLPGQSLEKTWCIDRIELR